MTVVDDVAPAAASDRTPRRIFRPRVARERIEHIARLCEVLGRPPLGVVPSYGVTTNPRAELLRLARERGFFAETTCAAERRWVEGQGFIPDRIIASGPEPLPDRSGERLAFAFADSLEAFAANVAGDVAHVAGVRLRPSMIASRFGVALEDDAALRASAAASPSQTRLGVSFDARREGFHGASWRDVAADVLARAVELEREAARRVVAFDAGGGWTPEQFDAEFAGDVRWLVERVVAALPACRYVIVEPSQALCPPTEALLTAVLEVRERRGRREAIIDAGCGPWPQVTAGVHRFFAWRDGGWQPLGVGPDRVGGPTSLEDDVVDGIRLPPGLGPGERLLITGTGSRPGSIPTTFNVFVEEAPG